MNNLKELFNEAYNRLVVAKTEYEMYEVKYAQTEIKMVGQRTYQEARNAEDRSRTLVMLMSDEQIHGEDMYRKRADLKLESTLAYYEWQTYKTLLEAK